MIGAHLPGSFSIAGMRGFEVVDIALFSRKNFWGDYAGKAVIVRNGASGSDAFVPRPSLSETERKDVLSLAPPGPVPVRCGTVCDSFGFDYLCDDPEQDPIHHNRTLISAHHFRTSLRLCNDPTPAQPLPNADGYPVYPHPEDAAVPEKPWSSNPSDYVEF